jgi:predicted double-glycine peptidase
MNLLRGVTPGPGARRAIPVRAAASRDSARASAVGGSTQEVADPPRPADLLPVPDTRQCTDYSCGASALQAVLMYWGIEYREDELMSRLHTDPENGTNPKEIVRVAGEEGLKAQLRENVSLNDVRSSIDKGNPVIIDCQAWREGDDLQKPWRDIWDSGHYMVVVGMDDKNVYFEDPSILGSVGWIARPEFEERWHDIDDHAYDHGAIFIEGDRPHPPPALLHVD